MRVYKFAPPATRYWFTGCTHIYHKQPFIWEKRGYKSIMDHAAGVQEIINAFVKATDVLFHLGDGFLNSTADEAQAWFKGINCQSIYYIDGNHESAMKQLYRAAVCQNYNLTEHDVYPTYFKNLIFCGPKVEMGIENRMITLSHFPHAVWNKSHHGAWNLHSHCHGSFAESLPYHDVGKRLDVGWDVFKRPVNLIEIDEIMARKKISVVDHHNSSTT